MAEKTGQILQALDGSDRPILSTVALPDVPTTAVKSALDRLASRDMVVYEAIDKEEAILTPEAEGIAKDGSHEAKVFEAVRKAVEGLKITDLSVSCRRPQRYVVRHLIQIGLGRKRKCQSRFRKGFQSGLGKEDQGRALDCKCQSLFYVLRSLLKWFSARFNCGRGPGTITNNQGDSNTSRS